MGKIISLCGKTRGSSNILKKSTLKFKHEKKPHLRTLQLLFENSSKRPVFLDGCNVGFNHSQQCNFSVEGVEIALNTVAGMGHSALAVVPRKWLTNTKTTNPNLLQSLEDDDRLIFTPFDNKYGTCNASYDDCCTLDLAVKYDAAIISNDQFKDLINKNPAWRNVIESRVISFMFINDKLILPDDPYGKNGPRLNEILNKY